MRMQSRDILMLDLGRLYYTNRGFDLLASLRKCNLLFIGSKITKQLAFLIISSTPFLENIKPLFPAKSAYFHRIPCFSFSRNFEIFLKHLTLESSTSFLTSGRVHSSKVFLCVSVMGSLFCGV